MARTRGASLNRSGAPTTSPPQPAALPTDATTLPPSEQPPPGPPPIRCYRAEARTLPRNLDGWELAGLFDLALKHGNLEQGLAVELTPDEYGHLPGSLRRLFVATRRALAVWTEYWVL